MTWRNKRDHFNNYTCKWRNSNLGKTNTNHHYFMRLLKKETESFLRANKQYLLNNKPEIYYSMINRKLPKKYMKQNEVVTPVNAYVPPQSKLSPEELDKQLEQEALERKKREEALREKQQKEMKEKERKERNRAALAKEQRYIYWCDAHEQGNYVSIHSDKFKSRGKKYEYY
jgi:type IV secretory pathway VirB10-like protein